MSIHNLQERKNEVMRLILSSGGVEIRDVDAGEEAFLYSSGNYGPGYVDIKGRVGFDGVFEPMISLLADILIARNVRMDMIVGMMTGGSIPGYRIKQLLSERLGRDIVYIYQRGARKVGGHGELDTGDRNNPYIPGGAVTLIIEELVNFAATTCNGARYEREEKGRTVTDAATVLFYQNPVAAKRLKQSKINLHWAVALPELLDFGIREGFLAQHIVGKYRAFLDDPKKWNEDRGFIFHSGE